MIFMLGIGPEADISDREKYALTPTKQIELLKESAKDDSVELVIVNTCNRTEIYFRNISPDKIYQMCGWQGDCGLKLSSGDEVISHLFKLSAGFLSAIKGEDQILGQLKGALVQAEEYNSARRVLSRLFQKALACGKEFKNTIKDKLPPYSVINIVKKISEESGCQDFVIAGYGNFGKFACQTLLTNEQIHITILSRSLKKAPCSQTQIASFDHKREILAKADCLISITSAPHYLFLKDDFSKPILAFDLAVPRDIDPAVTEVGVKLYDVDSLVKIQAAYLEERLMQMEEFRYIVSQSVDDFKKWLSEEELKPIINNIISSSNSLYLKKKGYYQRKHNFVESEKLIDGVLKSSCETFAQRAIEVLREEHSLGRGKVCQEILKKIFQQ